MLGAHLLALPCLCGMLAVFACAGTLSGMVVCLRWHFLLLGVAVGRLGCVGLRLGCWWCFCVVPFLGLLLTAGVYRV